MSYLGVNIGGTTCSVSRGTAAGEIIEQESFPTTDVATTVAKLKELAKRLVRDDVIAVGISCGGPLDAEAGLVLSPPNLPGWDRIPIVKEIEEVTRKRAYLMNDANAGGVAEWLFGTGGQCPSLVFLTCGTGLGSGIVINGQVLDGVNGNGGEVGHIKLTEGGPVGYNKAGSFEGWCSGTGFRQYAGWNAKDAAAAARAGDKKAISDFEEFGRKLGYGLAIIIDTVNPARIVMGGVYMRCEDLIAPAMREVLEREALPQSLAVCEITKSVCGEQIGDKAALAVAGYHCAADPVDQVIRRFPALAGCRAEMRSAAGALCSAFQAGHKLLLCGNGGSWSDAHHIAGELLKAFARKRPVTGDWTASVPQDIMEKMEKGFPAIVLGSAGAFASAFGNDVDPTLAYAQEVLGLGVAGDVFLGISTSGNAKNVAAAAKVAKAKGLTVIGLTGRDGGALYPLCDICIRVPERETYRVQELHLPVYHTLCFLVENHFFA